MAFDYSKLRGRIVEKFGTIKAFANAYGITSVSMSKKLNGDTAFSQDDIMKMSTPELLDIQAKDIPEYFFKI